MIGIGYSSGPLVLCCINKIVVGVLVQQSTNMIENYLIHVYI